MDFRFITSIIFLCTIIHEGCTKNCTHDIPHGHVTWWCSTNAGNMCPYSCDKGYEENPDVSWISCSSSGEWRSFKHVYYMSADDFCLPKSCPKTIPNGKLSDACDATVGTDCDYSCNSGYRKNAAIISCETSTNWSTNPHSLCTSSRQCPYEIEHGELELSCRRMPGESCNFTCHEGYLPSTTSPTMEITCGASLIWSKPLSSLCEQILCPTVIPNGVVSSDCSREYKKYCYNFDCDNGYTQLRAAPSIRCNASGQWSWGEHQGEPCAKIDELCPSKIKNGHIIWHCHRQHGATCTYDCDSGCTEDRSRVWLNCDSKSMWDTNTDTLCTCGLGTTSTTTSTRTLTTTPTAVPNLCASRIPNGHIDRGCNRRQFSTCSYKCDDGCYNTYRSLYCTSLGNWVNGYSACRCNGGHVTSDTSAPTTALNTCPITIPNGYISAICSRVPFYRCDYACHNGCRKMYSSLYCTSFGSWNNGRSACKCQGNDIQSESQGFSSVPAILGVIGGVVGLFVLIFACGCVYFKKARQQRQTNSYCQPSTHNEQPTANGRNINGTSNSRPNPVYTLPNQTNLYTSIQLPPNTEENSYTQLRPPSGDHTSNIQNPKPPEYSTIAPLESRENPPPYELVIAHPADFRI